MSDKRVRQALARLTLKRGDALGSLLDELIDMKAGDGERGPVVDDMASSAGISASTVNQIVQGSIICPPRARLEGLADALGVGVDRLLAAARRDGCMYDDE